ncbi:MAG: S8 family serine peptidase [Nanoarchaeota archaeon]
MRTLREIGLAAIVTALCASLGLASEPRSLKKEGKASIETQALQLGYMPGQAIVQFDDNPFELPQNVGPQNPYASLPTTQIRTRNATLEALINQFGISAVQPLTPKAKVGDKRANIYLLTFDAATDVNSVISALHITLGPMVRFAEKNTVANFSGTYTPETGTVETGLGPVVQNFTSQPPANNLAPTPRSEEWHHLNTGQTILGVPGLSGADLKSQPAWVTAAAIQDGGQNCIFYVVDIDTGVDLTNPRIVGRVDPDLSYNFADMNSNISDTNPQHGTGVLLAGFGYGADQTGVNWTSSVKLIMKKISNNPASAPVANRIMAIDDTTAQIDGGVPIFEVLFPYGGTGQSNGELNALIDLYNRTDSTGNGRVGFVMAGGDANANQFEFPGAFWYTNGSIDSLTVTSFRNNEIRNPYTRGLHVNFAGYDPVWAGGGGFFSQTSAVTGEVGGVYALLKSVNPSLSRDQIYLILRTTARAPLVANPECSENTSCDIPDLDAATDIATRPPYCNTNPSDITTLLFSDTAGVHACKGEQATLQGAANSSVSCGISLFDWVPDFAPPTGMLPNPTYTFDVTASGSVRMRTRLNFERPECEQERVINVVAEPHVSDLSTPAGIAGCTGTNAVLSGTPTYNSRCQGVTPQFKWTGSSGQNSGVLTSPNYQIALDPAAVGMWTLYAWSVEDGVQRSSTTEVSIEPNVVPGPVKNAKIVKTPGGIDATFDNSADTNKYDLMASVSEDLSGAQIVGPDIAEAPGVVTTTSVPNGVLPAGAMIYFSAVGESCDGTRGPN